MVVVVVTVFDFCCQIEFVETFSERKQCMNLVFEDGTVECKVDIFSSCVFRIHKFIIKVCACVNAR